MKKIIIIVILSLFLSGCGITTKLTKKDKIENKTETKNSTSVEKNDSINYLLNILESYHSDTLNQNIVENADSIIVSETEEITKVGNDTVKITKTKNTSVYRPVKEITTNSKTEDKLSTVTVDSIAVNKIDSTAITNEKTSSVNQHEEKKEFKWSVPWYVYLGIGLIIILIINDKWKLGQLLMVMLKKLLEKIKSFMS